MALSIRAMQKGDSPAILDLVNADRLEGQPGCTQEMLDCTLAGRSPIDASSWEKLTNLRTDVAVDEWETICGVVSFALHREDREGYLLWLHAREDRGIIEVLIQHVVTALGHVPRLHAFALATPLTFGVEALPVRKRPVSHQTLLNQGFTGEDSWLYMLGPTISEAEAIAEIAPTNHPNEWELSVRSEQHVVGKAVVGFISEKTGVFWWLFIEEAQRGQGIGKRLFQQARKWLYDQGVQTILLYVDHTTPERAAAIHLYASTGFALVDCFWSYWKDAPLL